jgi:hypothetical protein
MSEIELVHLKLHLQNLRIKNKIRLKLRFQEFQKTQIDMGITVQKVGGFQQFSKFFLLFKLQ